MEFEHSKVMSSMDLINTLEHIEPYKLQVDVVNMSFTMKCGFHGINIKPIFHNHCRGYRKMPKLPQRVVKAGSAWWEIAVGYYVCYYRGKYSTKHRG